MLRELRTSRTRYYSINIIHREDPQVRVTLVTFRAGKDHESLRDEAGDFPRCLWLHAGATPGAIKDHALHVYPNSEDSSRILAQASPIATASIKVRQSDEYQYVYAQFPRGKSGPMTPVLDSGSTGGVKVLSVKTYKHADGAFRTGIRCSWHQI
jgi:hypothetical protein